MKVLFIDSPPTLDWTPESGLTKGGRRWPSLAVSGEKTYCYLNLGAAAVLRERGHEVGYIDCQAEGLTLRDAVARARALGPDLVVFYVEQLKFPVDLAVIEGLRDNGEPVIALVGPFVTPLFKEAMTVAPRVDYVIRGEYDLALADLADALQRKRDPSTIPGIVGREGGQAAPGPDPVRIKDLDALPIPAYDLVDLASYTESVFIYSPSAAMVTSRGCPYRCIYCWFPQTIYTKRWVGQSPARMVREVRTLVEDFGVKEIKIDDDTFEMDRERVVEFCRLLIAEGVEVAWAPQCRPDLVDEELMAWMSRAGCIRVLWGCESGSQEILDRIKKDFRVEDIIRANRLCRKYGVEALNCFMLGFPWDTEETMKKTISLACELNGEFAQFAIPTPLPGTHFYDLARGEGYIRTTRWEFFDGSHRAVASYPGLSAETIEAYSKSAYHDYYLRPGYAALMLKRALKSPAHFRHTLRLLAAFLKRRKVGWI